ncbi:hypothetical protein L218DRAFT_134109 [Marasmius fiardii PR-910]|nr:hypothetical protein L218DRAFT_134109 [Marasmius fiardii PR-910]
MEYTGCDAHKLFKRDFLTFSHTRHANVMQLRGFNDSDTPMVLFHEELIPIQIFIQQHHEFSLFLQVYFSLQATIAQLSIHKLNMMEQKFYFCGDVWVRPGNGKILLGTRGPWPDQHFPTWLSVDRYSDIPVLPTGMYETSCVFKFLLSFSPDRFFLECLSWMRHSSRPLQKDSYTPPWQYISAHSSGHCIASIQSELYWTHSLSAVNLEDFKPVNMGDGRTRLLMRSIAQLRGTLFYYRFVLDSAESFLDRRVLWLSQSLRIFGMLNIPKKEWSDYALCGDIFLCLRTEWADFLDESGSLDSDMISEDLESLYLFLLPPPQLPDSYPDKNTWMSGKNLYYWSSDPDGLSSMSKSQCASLGLPFLVPRFIDYPWTWISDIYDLIQVWQEAKGFDPTTTDFAHSLGLPTMEVILPDVDNIKVPSEDIDSLCIAKNWSSTDEIVMDIDLAASSLYSEMESHCHSDVMCNSSAVLEMGMEVD